MTLAEFDAGYFYATELKAFAKELGLKVGSLRKNEVEAHIRAVLSGKTPKALPKSVPNRKTSGVRDELTLEAPIVNYVSDKATKGFLKAEIHKIDPAIRDKSGQWYWLNDWRKKQIGANRAITYGDLVDRLYELMTTEGKLPRIPSTRFNNFISDFLADPANKGKSRQQAMAAWEELKTLPVQKTYQDYKKAKK